MTASFTRSGVSRIGQSPGVSGVDEISCYKCNIMTSNYQVGGDLENLFYLISIDLSTFSRIVQEARLSHSPGPGPAACWPYLMARQGKIFCKFNGNGIIDRKI